MNIGGDIEIGMRTDVAKNLKKFSQKLDNSKTNRLKVKIVP